MFMKEEMYISQKTRKNHTKLLLIILAFSCIIWGANQYHHQKLSQAHQRAFVEGCVNVLALEFQARTGLPVFPEMVDKMVRACIDLERRNNAVQK